MGYPSFVGSICFWILTLILIPILLILFTIVLAITSILWLINPKTSEYESYNLEKGRQHTKTEILKKYNLSSDLVRTTFVDVPGVGTETWKIHTLFCEAKKDSNLPYLVLIHGTGSGSMSWCNILNDLMVQYRVIAIDMPGFGESPTPECLKHASADEGRILIIDMLNKWLDAINITEKVIVLGHSYGGFISIGFAHKYPEKVDRVILADAVGILPILDSVGAHWGVFFKLSPIQNMLRCLGPLAIWMAYTWFHAFDVDAEFYYWLQLLSEPTAVGDLLVGKHISVNWINGQVYWTNPVLKEVLQLRVPITLIYGEHDTIVPAHQGRVIADLLGPNIKCIEMACTGHSIIYGSGLANVIHNACISACTADTNVCQLVDHISDDALCSFRTHWCQQESMQIIETLYSWLHGIKSENNSITNNRVINNK